MNRLACMAVGWLALLLLSVLFLRSICLSIRALWLTSEFEPDVRPRRDHAGDGAETRAFTTGIKSTKFNYSGRLLAADTLSPVLRVKRVDPSNPMTEYR